MGFESAELEKFKRTCADFLKEVATLDERTLDRAWEAVAKAYLNFDPPSKLEQIMAVSTFEYCARRKLDREVALMGELR